MFRASTVGGHVGMLTLLLLFLPTQWIDASNPQFQSFPETSSLHPRPNRDYAILESWLCETNIVTASSTTAFYFNVKIWQNLLPIFISFLIENLDNTHTQIRNICLYHGAKHHRNPSNNNPEIVVVHELFKQPSYNQDIWHNMIIKALTEFKQTRL